MSQNNWRGYIDQRVKIVEISEPRQEDLTGFLFLCLTNSMGEYVTFNDKGPGSSPGWGI